MNTRLLIPVAAVLAACSRSIPVATAPAPRPAPERAAITEPVVTQPGTIAVAEAPAIPAGVPMDTARVAAKTAQADSVRIDSAEVKRRAAEVFGDSTMPPAA